MPFYTVELNEIYYVTKVVEADNAQDAVTLVRQGKGVPGDGGPERGYIDYSGDLRAFEASKADIQAWIDANDK